MAAGARQRDPPVRPGQRGAAARAHPPLPPHLAGHYLLTGYTVTPDHLRTALTPLLAGPDRCAAIAARAREHGRPDAAQRLVDVLFRAVASSRTKPSSGPLR
ncbi:hypothetical protein KSE_05730 [Kitasatospora setae KM-6054]|uniref:Uncharacterized protein n=1 Tax=Kitasatospora setae (strain ATCC 33774 / DSM 43861 / JCM 3304 / KCC A-0304 / NBRC 14216 / KM-6054) TaxID=452652 RepID=E4N5D5_KITSK|nr:hypothetical protein KSE_05730 [Kitasatospora setae KM-6054]